MSGLYYRLVVFVLCLAASAAPVAAADIWWQTAEVQRALRLTPQQVQKLEQIFHEDLEQRAATRRTLRELEIQFATALQDGDVTQIEQSGLIDQMEELRVRINVRRALMLLAMYRTLSPEQRKALATMSPPGKLGRTPARPYVK